MKKEDGYLSSKLLKLRGFFSLVFGEMDEEKTAILEEKLIEMYAKKGITFDDETLYQSPEREKIAIIPQFKSNEEMPILQD